MQETPESISQQSGQAADRQPTEAELRAAVAAELKQIKVSDLLLQTAVSLLNLAAVRLGLVASESTDGGEDIDLDQAKHAIDALRDLIPHLEIGGVDTKPLRDGLSNLQMAYVARQGGGSESRPDISSESKGGSSSDAGSGRSADGDLQPEPGPAQSSGRLWVPGS